MFECGIGDGGRLISLRNIQDFELLICKESQHLHKFTFPNLPSSVAPTWNPFDPVAPSNHCQSVSCHDQVDRSSVSAIFPVIWRRAANAICCESSAYRPFSSLLWSCCDCGVRLGAAAAAAAAFPCFASNWCAVTVSGYVQMTQVSPVVDAPLAWHGARRRHLYCCCAALNCLASRATDDAALQTCRWFSVAVYWRCVNYGRCGCYSSARGDAISTRQYLVIQRSLFSGAKPLLLASHRRCYDSEASIQMSLRLFWAEMQEARCSCRLRHRHRSAEAPELDGHVRLTAHL